MKIIKRVLYIVGAIILIIVLFFSDDISDEIDNVLWVLSGVLLFLIVVTEIFIKRK